MPVPKTYRVHSRDAFGPVYHVQVFEGIAACNCKGYEAAGHCWHQERALEMQEQEEGTESRALVPIMVMPPATMLPTPSDISIIGTLARSVIGAKGHAVPEAIDSPAKAFAVMLAGWEMGARPMTALRHVFVVNGRTEPDAQLMMGIVRARDATAHFVFHERTATACDVELWRHGAKVIRIRYSVEDAKTAGQLQRERSPWRSYPADMCAWAAVKRCCRFGAPDLINAISGNDIGEAEDMMNMADAVELADPLALPAEALTNEGDEPVTVDAETGEILDPAEVAEGELAPEEEAAPEPPSKPEPRLSTNADLFNAGLKLGYKSKADILTALGYRSEMDIADRAADYKRLRGMAGK